MVDEQALRSAIATLLEKCQRLNLKNESEKRAEEFLKPLFEAMGWDWLSEEVKPQTRVRSGSHTTRVDYAFRKASELRASFYLEVKRFSNALNNNEDIEQALSYGKNSGIRWVVLTNFLRWRVYNSDFFDRPEDAELFQEFSLEECLQNEERLHWLLLLSRERGGLALDQFAKAHKKWKESESVEDLLTEQLLKTRERLTKAIREQNSMLFDTSQQSEDVSLDACVQHILDRIIFSRMLEDNGVDPELQMKNVLERWEQNKRIQFYREYLCLLWEKMKKRYDSTIFDSHRIDGLTIKNEDFVPLLREFYVHPKTGLRYRFEAIGTDILGHAYENYLSYKVKQTAKRTGLEKERYGRKQSGIYYTPQFLVEHLVRATAGELLERCKSPQEALQLRILDPACGSGTFLVQAYEQFKSWFVSRARNGNGGNVPLAELSSFLDAVLENCLYGIDKDPRATRLARLNLFLRAADNPKKLPRLKIVERDSLVEDLEFPRAFVFKRVFPLVHEHGGFDVLLGNPPWEKWKPDSQEFFEEKDPGFKGLPTQQAKRRMAELMRTRPYLKKAWHEKLQEYEAYSTYFREHYQWQSAEAGARKVSGDIDFYKLFAERAYQLLKEGGMAGLVLPSGIYTDLGAKGLRSMLFDHTQVKSLYSFENRGQAIFPDVHASYKPILLAFRKGGKTASFPCAFFLHGADDLKRALQHPTVISTDFIKASSPTSWGVLEIKTPLDYQIVQKLLSHPPLGQRLEGTWNITISRGFDMTNDSHLFQEGKLFGIPMLEGKNIEQYTHQWRGAPTPRYKIFEKDILENIKPEKIYHKGYWMAYRLIASSTNYRTFISTVVPPGYVCGHSIAIVRLPNLKELCFLVGIMNSFVVDYFIRQKVSANVTMFNFLETPVPRLSSGKEYEAISRRVAQLVCVTREFSQLQRNMGVEGVTNEADRALVRAQIDALAAQLYGISRDEMAHILQQFPLVEQKQKDIVLAEMGKVVG
ncbi:MAG: N-6 DNA methylase [Candidatus Aenigmarchaeota archaeon]|nr:N-6 DNA methylase [Candidatus Aenigmarchaeota archaeon]